MYYDTITAYAFITPSMLTSPPIMLILTQAKGQHWLNSGHVKEKWEEHMLELIGLIPLNICPSTSETGWEKDPQLGEQSTVTMPGSEQTLTSYSVGSNTESGKQLVWEEVALPADFKINQRVTGISSAINPLPPSAWLIPSYSSLHLNISSVGTFLNT